MRIDQTRKGDATPCIQEFISGKQLRRPSTYRSDHPRFKDDMGVGEDFTGRIHRHQVPDAMDDES